MKPDMTTSRRRCGTRLALAVATAALVAAVPARAENHALIMWIGSYANPKLNIKGVERDAAMAREIAAAMGIPGHNITELRNQDLTHGGIGMALESLARRIKDGDKVFLYYSGHGTQIDAIGGTRSKCSEGLLTYDARLYTDDSLQRNLERLAARASQVVFLNDSCYSGGAITKASSARGASADDIAKYSPAELNITSANDPGYQCAQPINKMGRNLEAVGREHGTSVLYLTAAGDHEVAYATHQGLGSMATLAWASCLRDPAADTDRSGMLNGEEMRACAQRWIDANASHRQTITVMGNTRLPMSFASSPSSSDTSPVLNSAASVLEDIRAAADASYKVELQPERSSMRIGADELDFTISTNKAGYLYILHVGSDGKFFSVLFPNAHDDNNYINAGRHHFPRQAWRVRAGGPAGTSHLLAYVAPQRKAFISSSTGREVFATFLATPAASKNMFIEATGATPGGQGRYGASAVAHVREVR